MKRKERRSLIITIIVSTLVLAAVIGGMLYYKAALPAKQLAQLEKALEFGDIDFIREHIDYAPDGDTADAFLRECNYLEAASLMKEDRWADAEKLFLAAGGLHESEEMINQCRYMQASELLESCSYDDAAELFRGLAGYGNSSDMFKECRYRKAEELETCGSSSEAALMFFELGDYRDSLDRAAALACSITSLNDPDEAIAILSGLSPEALARIEELSDARNALPRGIIATGFYHTVGLKADGTVLACGDNSFGQCEVAGIKNAKAIAAGAYHTLVLLDNGTVAAIGRNDEGQCEVSEWKDIIAISACDYASFGLTSDGHVLSCGYGDRSSIEALSSVKSISGGSYAVGAIDNDGTVFVYPSIAADSRAGKPVELALNSGYYILLFNDGNVYCSAFDVIGINDAVAVSASGTCFAVLRLDGSVAAHFFRESDTIDFSTVKNATALSVGGTHYVFVLEDGSVAALGDNSHGECDTSGWMLF